MLRTRFRIVSKFITSNNYSSAPAEQKKIISASFKVQNNKDFLERVKNSKVPVIVDFFATWCNPCRLLTPRIEQLVGEKQGKILLAKVDIDENTDLAMDYDIASVPVLMVMKDGKVMERLIGLQDIDKLKKFINKHAN
ncbi:PREDICTED: thioredoxin, mitochondrial [Ceratosolen solmsi marchali]|uniref:Thioredoxin, mitochondrial n=1 Tax=Ceratosolen solmsi marchali TaxID=326594 RepID=A0AAJ6YFU2_9HYME|nr:PREDICTED: thioredoxin, mitochondrial [Ceratosolen solmsi marchali]XP_011497287.1 PREDICTED: thioredoxin, mitochondrial [Ceratosolen solmsi marchali]